MVVARAEHKPERSSNQTHTKGINKKTQSGGFKLFIRTIRV